jgi:diaminopimelate epimerase
MTRFHKYQALGNDMIVLDPRHFGPAPSAAAIRLICHRHLGPGADGICYGPLLPDQAPPWPMRFFNPDGSEAEKSGNGLRIFARYLWDAGYVSRGPFTLLMNQEELLAQIENESATRITTAVGRLLFWSQQMTTVAPADPEVDMPLTVGGETYAATVVSIGNPHCVIFRQAVDPALAREVGPLIERAPAFPRRTNVQFVRVIDKHHIQIEIWERGAGYTLASGTSACAAAGAAVKTGRCLSPIEVRMAGGSAQVTVSDDWTATLSGPVHAVCSGELAADLVQQLREVSAP